MYTFLDSRGQVFRNPFFDEPCVKHTRRLPLRTSRYTWLDSVLSDSLFRALPAMTGATYLCGS